MKVHGIVAPLLLGLLVASPVAAASGPGLGREPTSPSGWSDAAPHSLADRIVHEARSFRGNPLPLAVLTGAVLAVALAFGVYTVAQAYRRPT